MTLLDVQHISKAFGGAQVLNDVSFTLAAGESIGIVGDNGAGKSTLLKCLSGAIRPDQGHILFEGRSLRMGDTKAIRQAGIDMVYQDLSLCRQHSVVTNIMLGREIKTSWGTLDRAAMVEKSKDALANLNAEIPVESVVGDLSGGQQQAVAIARAMLGQPKLVILDEPTAALGVRESARVLSFIQNLTRQSVATIIVSHHLPDVIATTHRVLLMRQGRISKVFETPKVSAATLGEEISQAGLGTEAA
jgi:ABC-type sugar transport system ATPase subunit